MKFRIFFLNEFRSQYGLIWLDGGAKNVLYLHCFFFNNIGNPWYKLGINYSPQPPSFENCFFDINYISLSGCLTISCNFQISLTITYNLDNFFSM